MQGSELGIAPYMSRGVRLSCLSKAAGIGESNRLGSFCLSRSKILTHGQEICSRRRYSAQGMRQKLQHFVDRQSEQNHVIGFRLRWLFHDAPNRSRSDWIAR